jgi:formylglycine-generating enzyme required for sulfatase activity
MAIEDMAGNVWEWCPNSYLDADDALSAGEEPELRVLRSHSWNGDRGFARCVVRSGSYPRTRDFSFGLRVVRSFER